MLALDGDLVRPGAGRNDPQGATEQAVRTLAGQLRLSDSATHDALEQGESADFEQSKLHRRLFALA